MTFPVASEGDRTPSLARCVAETERHVAAAGWDAPVRVFALVDAARALAEDPSLAGLWPISPDPHHLVAVEQEGLPHAETLEELLAQLGWPEAVDGVAIVLERIVVPPGAEEGLDGAAAQDEQLAAAQLAAHPQAQDVRMAVGVLRTGESWCCLRARSHDHDDSVAGSAGAVPGLVQALAATLE